MRKFRTGDRCEIIEANQVPEVLGMYCTVLDHAVPRADQAPDYWYVIKIDGYPSRSINGTWDGAERSLKKIDDGREPASWDECEWFPEKVHG